MRNPIGAPLGGSGEAFRERGSSHAVVWGITKDQKLNHRSGDNLVPTLVLNDTRVDRHHGCTRVMQALDCLLSRNNCRVIGRVPAHADWRSHPHFLAMKNDVRLVVINGEGTLHHDRPAGRRLLEIGVWAKAQGIPAVLVNAGWEANGAEMSSMLGAFELVAVRDQRSEAELREAGVQCTVVPDLSLYVSHDESSRVRAGLAFIDSVDRRTTVRLDRARRGMRAEWLPIQSRPRHAGEGWRFLREGVSKADLLQPGVGFGMLRARNAMRAARVGTPKEFLDGMATRRLIVSGRFHACALALVSATPFVAVPSNTAKIAALVEDAGLRSWRADSDLSAEHLQEAMRTGWERDEPLAIAEFLRSARSRAEALFREIGGLA